MSDKLITDAGAGRAVFLTRVKLSLHAFSMAFWLGAFPGLLIPIVLWCSQLSPRDLDVVKLTVVSQVVNQDIPRKWVLRDVDGATKVLTVVKTDGNAVQLLTAPQFRIVASSISTAMRDATTAAWASLFVAFVGYLLVFSSLRRIGKSARENKRIDGAKDLVSPKALSRLVMKEEPGAYSLLDVALPRSAPMQGILLQGAQGTGKSLGMHDLMKQAFARKRKCIIYDPSGEYFRAHFRPGIDEFFNPALEGSVPWSIFSELEYEYDANTLAHAFLPPKGGVVHGASAFFEDAARALFSVILLRLAQRGAEHTHLIADAFLEMPDDEMDLLIKNSVASSAVGGDSKGQRQGVISSIAIYLDGISSVQPGTWSIRDFLDRDDDSRLFLLSTDDTEAMFTPLFRLLLTVAFGMIAAKQEIVHEDRYWFLLDEVAKIGDIKLDKVQAELRKYGVCVAAGIQSDKQLVTSMGQDRGETVLNCFNTVAMLRANEPNMAKRMASRLGEQDVAVVSKGQALAVTDWRDGGSLNQGEQNKWLVMPSKIGQMKNCTAYVRIPGDYPATFVDFRHWLPRWYRPFARVLRFKEAQSTPPRDPRFRVIRAAGQDAMASVREEADRVRAETAKAEEEKKIADAERAAAAKEKLERKGVWIVTDLETGEIVRADRTTTETSGGDKAGNKENKGLW
ncbi:type IV secretion system DNA-binding domain-containing protein [Pandoraea commovens]|uniref:Type IV secretion system DNA-binding domain-containing protein n=1 Tax=Pandoraea commovens TaxID=2508289 RepID=A0ABY5QAL2_9BURK|nr:type IV secretion system DNA-binding domain-containing protein [Pandoraea commovens]UVA77188.1 type IV secretion system DNA-binding domain-containing protein [Pandoraea commovens]